MLKFNFDEITKEKFEKLFTKDQCDVNKKYVYPGHTVIMIVTEDWEKQSKFNFESGLYVDQDETITLYHPYGSFGGFLDDSIILMTITSPGKPDHFFIIGSEPAPMYERENGIEDIQGSEAGYTLSLKKIKSMLKANGIPYDANINLHILQSM